MKPARKKFIADVLRTAAQLVEDGVITEFNVTEQPDGSGNKTMTITLQTGNLLAAPAAVPSLGQAGRDAGDRSRRIRPAKKTRRGAPITRDVPL